MIILGKIAFFGGIVKWRSIHRITMNLMRVLRCEEVYILFPSLLISSLIPLQNDLVNINIDH